MRVLTASGWTAAHPDTLSNLTALGVNTTPDAVNRLAVASAASLFSHDGAGHHLKINKAAPEDTASLLFQTNWSGRAEMGTNGSDAWSLKVSADGTNWQDAVIAQGGTGQISLPNGVSISGAVDLPEASIGRSVLVCTRFI